MFYCLAYSDGRKNFQQWEHVNLKPRFHTFKGFQKPKKCQSTRKYTPSLFMNLSFPQIVHVTNKFGRSEYLWFL